jgi:MFS family permease
MLVAFPLDEGSRLAIVAGAVTLCVAPLLATRARPTALPADNPGVERVLRHDLVVAWASRLLVQVAGAVMSLYLLYYFESIGPPASSEVVARHVGHVLAFSYFLPLPIAVLVGRWSDRTGRGKPFLLAAGMVSALGLLGMALAEDWTAGAAAFAVYSVGWSVFLALHSGFAMQLLPDPRHRGRDLGLLNLTNTLPQLAGPLMAWLLATPHDFDAALLTLAVLTTCGALTILAVRGRR